MTNFTGFPDADGRFFQALAKHNERAWFLAHKTEYEEGYNLPMKALLGTLRASIDKAYPRCDLAEPKVFRIFRDVRFSKDKSPYKTHIGGFIPLARSGKKVTDLPMALYFHVGAKETFAAAGHYMMEKESLEGFRASIADPRRGKELVEILASLAKKGFVAAAHDKSKRVPKGYPADHPRAELLTYKGLTVSFPKVPKGMLTSPKLVGWLTQGCKASAPLVDWLVGATA
jgi:uncharacterized protein (TIGR02453 family)